MRPFPMVGFIIFWDVLWWEKGTYADVAFFHGRFYSILACFMVGKGLIDRCGFFPWYFL